MKKIFSIMYCLVIISSIMHITTMSAVGNAKNLGDWGGSYCRYSYSEMAEMRALDTAIEKSNIQSLKSILEKRLIDINKPLFSPESHTYALPGAALKSSPETVQFLLEHGADVHVDDDHSLITAASNGRHNIVQILLEHGANVHAQYEKALRKTGIDSYYSSIQNIFATIKLLIAAGATPAENIHDYLFLDREVLETIKESNLPMLKNLLETGSFNINTHLYAPINNHDSYGPDDDNYLLTVAVKKSSPEMVQLILEYGADVHIHCDKALKIAAIEGNSKTALILLKYGADIKTLSPGKQEYYRKLLADYPEQTDEHTTSSSQQLSQ